MSPDSHKPSLHIVAALWVNEYVLVVVLVVIWLCQQHGRDKTLCSKQQPRSHMATEVPLFLFFLMKHKLDKTNIWDWDEVGHSTIAYYLYLEYTCTHQRHYIQYPVLNAIFIYVFLYLYFLFLVLQLFWLWGHFVDLFLL